MALTIRQTATAIGPNCHASFQAYGGAEPYFYSVLSGGAGGTIDASTGEYTGPAVASSDPDTSYATIQVEDYDSVIATAQILVGTPLLLLCEILQQELGLASGRVYIWDQKINQPKDSGLYIAVSMPYLQAFSNVNGYYGGGAGLDSRAYANFVGAVDIDIISRGPTARDRKEEVVLALNSTYAQQQQEANSFYIGKIPPGNRMLNLSLLDGAAIPYRYKISVNMQYCVSKTKATQYFDEFSETEVNIDPESDSP